MYSTSFLGFSYPNLLLVFLNLLFFWNLYHIFLAASVGTFSHENVVQQIKIFVQDFVPIRTALRGGGVASSFILFFYLLYWYSYIVPGV